MIIYVIMYFADRLYALRFCTAQTLTEVHGSYLPPFILNYVASPVQLIGTVTDRVRISGFTLVVVLIAVVLGIMSGGVVGGMKGFVYSLAATILGSFLSLVPIAGPILTWKWLMPSFKSLLSLGEEFLIVDLLIMVPVIIVNAVVTLIVILIVEDLVQ
jgi:hypothetical protein